MSEAYYNEFNLEAAEWLEELIRQGHIAPGQVDTRSIEDVRPDDLRGFTQCHFFAGIGVWSYALRRAGWPDDRPVWTGSPPCQPFSAAGKGSAFADERHLWPAFHHLIKVGRPPSILGEQVASAPVDDWIDLVHADLEALGYTFGSVPFPSAGVGAPHIRDRNFWMGHASGAGLAQRERERGILGGAPGAVKGQASIGTSIHAGGLADADGIAGGQGCAINGGRHSGGDAQSRPGFGGDGVLNAQRTGPTNGFWRDADWIGCRDGKWRPVEPASFPLAYGLASGMGALRAGQRRLAELAGLDAASLKRAKSHRIVGLRGAGNAINAEAAIAWVKTVMECI